MGAARSMTDRALGLQAVDVGPGPEHEVTGLEGEAVLGRDAGLGQAVGVLDPAYTRLL